MLMFFTANSVWREAPSGQEQRALCKYEPKQLSFDPGEQKDGLLTLITLIVSSSCLRVFKHNNCSDVDEKRRLFVFITDIFMILACLGASSLSVHIWSEASLLAIITIIQTQLETNRVFIKNKRNLITPQLIDILQTCPR